MTTWEEIRDEVAGLLADGKPLEDVLAKLEQRKNEMAKAELLKAMDDMKKPKPMTNEEWLRSCPPQELIRFLMNVAYGGQIRSVQKSTFDEEAEKWSKWLKEKYK